MRARRPDLSDDAILEAYAELEAAAERGTYIRYRDVLAAVVRGFGERFGFEPTGSELSCLTDSLGDWPPFDDTVASLGTLASALRLGIISNVDNDLFDLTRKRLGDPFDWVVTAEDVGSYKPCVRNFEQALATIGAPPSRVLHVAQSLYHDIEPASRMGIATVWVDRRAGRGGGGATPPSSAMPDLRVTGLAELVREAGLA